MKLGTVITETGMKLVALAADGRLVDLHAAEAKIPPTMRGLLGMPDGMALVASTLVKALSRGPFVEGRCLAPVPDPQKVICIGLNYRDHAIETGAPIPSEPVVFNKFPECVIADGEVVVLPRVSHEVDFEAELVAVIGIGGKNISKENAWKHVAGYTCGNDVSARDWQKGRPGNQWLLGKACDTFAPLGPWLVTADEVGDTDNLRVQLRLNGETMQNSTTKELIFSVDEVIAHISKLVTLSPGDLIFTGTPPGVGMARKPPVFLKAGDRMEVEIENVGVLTNSLVAE